MPRRPRPLMALRDIPASIGLLTRLPVKVNIEAAQKRGAAAAWAYPLVGLLTGGAAVAVGLGALWVGLPATIAAGLGVAFPILMTGALHEDGLADCADGFWGGWTRSQRLAIMKDSQIGTYGVLALILAIGLRWAALAALLPHGGWPWVLVGAVWSRSCMVIVMGRTPRARPRGLSARVGRPRGGTCGLAALVGLLTWIGLTAGMSDSHALGFGVALCSSAGAAWVAAVLARRKIGGQTGDVLGATQVLSELSVLLVAAAWMG